MSDELQIGAKKYISSKRAASLTGYTQDYVGQLARGGLIEAQRIGGLWYVLMDSLTAYKEKSDQYKPQPPQAPQPGSVTEAVVTFDGRDYVSASRAAKVTGYNQDYIGQLARSGAILARQIGNRWYVDREGLQTHKKEKDSLLAAVQSQSVGIRPTVPERSPATREEPEAPAYSAATEQPFYSYTSDSSDLLPRTEAHTAASGPVLAATHEEGQGFDDEQPVPIRVTHEKRRYTAVPMADIRPTKYAAPENYSPYAEDYTQEDAGFAYVAPASDTRAPRKGMPSYAVHLAGATLTVVIVLSFGVATFQKYQVYASAKAGQQGASGLMAAAGSAFTNLGNAIEQLISPELIYKRDN